jgi:hypothetical protein
MPVLMSAPSKKSFSSANWPIVAGSAFRSLFQHNRDNTSRHVNYGVNVQVKEKIVSGTGCFMNSFPHTKPTGEIANHVYATKALKTLIDRTNYFSFVAKIGARVRLSTPGLKATGILRARKSMRISRAPCCAKACATA